MPGEISRRNGKLGGRPKGSVSPETRAKIAITKALVSEVYEQRLKIAQALIRKATALGDVSAIREVYNRTLGRPKESTEAEDDIFLHVDF